MKNLWEPFTFDGMDLSSKWLEKAVEAFASLPGVGRKTALRYTLSLLQREPEEIEHIASAIQHLSTDVLFCQKCHNISDQPICSICSNPKRNETLICVVEDLRDVIALENTGQYNGLYHVLGGHISPMDGIGPNDLTIDSLINRVQSGVPKEIILALSTTMEGDTTNFYLYKKLNPLKVEVSTIARGIAIGDELEYTDEVTLGRSIINRTPYSSTLNA